MGLIKQNVEDEKNDDKKYSNDFYDLGQLW